MAKYIDADKVFKALNRIRGEYEKEDCTYAEMYIVDMVLRLVEGEVDETPAADVRPERHGEWVWGRFDGKGYPVWCSECGVRFIGNSNPAEWLKYPEHQYCGNCGAKMDGKDGESNDSH